LALGQATSGADKGRADTTECKLPAPRTELERTLQRKLRREMAEHPLKLPKGWVAGQCNYGYAVAP
jgi:hypothetical protein